MIRQFFHHTHFTASHCTGLEGVMRIWPLQNAPKTGVSTTPQNFGSLSHNLATALLPCVFAICVLDTTLKIELLYLRAQAENYCHYSENTQPIANVCSLIHTQQMCTVSSLGLCFGGGCSGGLSPYTRYI